MRKTFKCAWCGKEDFSKRATKEFCSGKCRSMYHWNIRKGLNREAKLKQR